MVPQITQHPLGRADGSAAFTDQLFAVLAAANGPMEVQRRDELPQEAAIEINVRPLSGVGGPRERWIESVLHSVLRSVLLVHIHPRTLVQLTLQITKEPEVRVGKGKSDISALPSLINAAFLALVDGGLPLRTSLAAVLVAVDQSGSTVINPTEKDLSRSRSVHALAYDMTGALLLDEAVGNFEVGEWEKVSTLAQDACVSAISADGADAAMANADDCKTPWLRQALEDKVRDASAWRQAT